MKDIGEVAYQIVERLAQNMKQRDNVVSLEIERYLRRGNGRRAAYETQERTP